MESETRAKAPEISLLAEENLDDAIDDVPTESESSFRDRDDVWPS